MSNKPGSRLWLLLLIVVLSGCQAEVASTNQNLTWQIKINQVEVKNALKTVEVVTLYNGEKKEIQHADEPGSGNAYVLLNLTITKAGSTNIIFDWNDVVIIDGRGQAYKRIDNDSFLSQHNYSPRLTGLPLRFGENSGWAGFEIPQSALNGDLYLVHRSTEGELKLKLRK